MRIGKIVTASAAEVEGGLADIVYFQGCDRACCYCFNPTLKYFTAGREVYPEDIVKELSDLSDYVILTGGEPLCQDRNDLEIIIDLCMALGKKVIIETSYYDKDIFGIVDKVLFCAKTFAIQEAAFKQIAGLDNVVVVVVIGHECLNRVGLTRILWHFKDLHVRFANDMPCDIRDVYRLFKNYKRSFKIFDKSCLKVN